MSSPSRHYFDNVKLDVIKSDDYAITVDPTMPDPDQPGEGGEGGEDGPTVPTNPVDPTYKPDLTDTAGRETYDDNNLTDIIPYSSKESYTNKEKSA